MTNKLRAFALKLIDTTGASEETAVNDFLGCNSIHAAFMAGVNVGINIMNHPMAQIFGAEYVDSSVARFQFERDVQVVADKGELSDEEVRERLTGKFGGGQPTERPNAASTEEEFDFDKFLRDLIGEIDDESL